MSYLLPIATTHISNNHSLDESIDDTLSALEQQTSEFANTDYINDDNNSNNNIVNLDQLNFTVNQSTNSNRKYAIVDVLNQSIKLPHALLSIDACIELILSTWKLKELKNKQAEDLYTLLQNPKYKMTIWEDLINIFYDKPSFICSKLLRIAKKISAMKLLLDYQKMIHLPNNPKEWSKLLNRLQKKSNTMHMSTRALNIPLILEEKSNEIDDDDDDDDADDNVPSFYQQSIDIDDNFNAVNASDAVADILLRNRKLFKKTSLYIQMTSDTNDNNRRGSTLLKSIFSKEKSPNMHQKKVSISENNILELNELKPINAHHVDTDSDITDMDDSKKHKSQTSISIRDSIRFSSVKYQTNLRSEWVNPTCEGCGHVIEVWQNDSITSKIITYQCRFLGHNFNSLVYFHDIYCENLRKYKESIRKYVLESQLSSNIRQSNISAYARILLNHYELSINIHSGKLPIPNKQINVNNTSKDLDDNISNKRDIAVRLLTRGEIISQTFKKTNINTYQHYVKDIRDLDNKEDNGTGDDLDNNIGLFDDIPKTIQYADSYIFGEPLFEFVVNLLLSKQTTALWRLLAYISMQMPTVNAIYLLTKHKSDLAKAKKMENLELVCTSIIQASLYPIGTALHLSGFMNDLAEDDLSREDDFREAATQYINIAENLVEHVESDHLLALLLEIPTDINNLNVFDIAIQFNLDDFFDNNRVDRVITHMHQQFDFLNPNKTFSTKEMSLYKMVHFMINSPSKFYYTPIGKWWTATILYIVYVAIVSVVCLERNYLYTDVTFLEWIMWIANAGYITYEVTEIILKRFEYFSETSNLFDSFISINWLFLAFLRLLSPYIFDAIYINGVAENDYQQEHPNATARNSILSQIYMFFFGCQMIILYLRFTSILSRSKKLGPLVRNILNMIADVLNFTLIVGLMMIGFIFAISFVAGPDTLPGCFNDEPTANLSALTSIWIFVFQTLLGQQEWHNLQSNECLGPNRSRIIETFIVIFSILGTILLLNLLIAMMASRYENARLSTSKDVNFSRTEETYQLAHRNALISAPFNIVAYLFSLIFELISIIIIILTRGKYVFDIFSLVPVSIDYNKPKDIDNKKNNNRCNKCIKNCKRIGNCCCTFIQRVDKLSINNNQHYIRNIYFNYGAAGRVYCRYCRMYIDKSGDISNYFNLFRNYRLDEDDAKLMTRLMSKTGLCPYCYRPYKILEIGNNICITDRLQRWEIQLEIISYYVFRIFVHIPMILILLLPAMAGGLSSYIKNIAKDSHNLSNDKYNKISTNNITSDEIYRNLVENVINDASLKDIDLLSTQIESLDNKFVNINNKQLIYQNKLNKIYDLLQKMNSNNNKNNKNNIDDNDENKKKIKKTKIAKKHQTLKKVSNDLYGNRDKSSFMD